MFIIFKVSLIFVSLSITIYINTNRHVVENAIGIIKIIKNVRIVLFPASTRPRIMLKRKGATNSPSVLFN